MRVIKLRGMKWAGHVARMGEERGVYRFLVWKPAGRRPLGRPRRRCVDNIRMDLQEVGCEYIPSAWSDGHCPHAARSHSFVYISTS